MMVAITCNACATSNIFPTLTDQIAGASSIAIDSATNRLYLVNANDKVAYDWHQGSFQVYDITNPLAPVLLNTLPTLSYSGEVSLDPVRKLAYLTNRFSETDQVTADRMYIINIDESSPDFLTYQEITMGLDPFGIECCYPVDRLWVAEGGKDSTFVTQYVDKADLAVGSMNMLAPLSTGGSFDANETTDLVILGTQAFMSRSRGGIDVINLDEVGVAGAEPLDYWIQDIETPRGIATDGTYIYIASEDSDTGEWLAWIHVINPASLVPLFDNTSAQVLDKEDNGILVTSIGLNERRDPQYVLVTTNYIMSSLGWNDDNYIEVLDRSTLTWLTEIPVGKEPFPMALYAPGGVDTYVYVANQIDNTLSIIDIATLTVVATYP